MNSQPASGIPKQGAARKRRERWQDVKLYAPFVLLFLAALYWAYQRVAPAPSDTLRVIAGERQGAYYAFAQAYGDFFARHGVKLEVLESQGSMENIEALKAERADVALVQSGLRHRVSEVENLQALGSLYDEPLWVFYRRGVEPLTGLQDLRGRRLAIGAEGSGTRVLAEQLLAHHDIHAQNSALAALSGEAGAKALAEQQVDALFVVAAASAPLVQRLLSAPEFELLSFRRAQAYALHHRYLKPLLLPEGAINLATNIPPNDIRLLAPSAMLLSRDDLHPALADLLLQAATEVHGKATFFAREGQYPSADYIDFPLSPEARRFYRYGPPFLQRYLPFWMATWIDRLKVMLLPLLALLLPLSKILPPTYRWSIRKRIYRWYDELQDVDDALLKSSNEAMINAAKQELQRVEREVTEMEVPLSYAQELYVLRQHIELLKGKVHEAARDTV